MILSLSLVVKGEPRETVGVKTQDEFAIRALGGVRRGVFAATAGERARRARRPRNVFVTNHLRRRVGDVFVEYFPSGVEFGPRVGFFLVLGGARDGVGVLSEDFVVGGGGGGADDDFVENTSACTSSNATSSSKMARMFSNSRSRSKRSHESSAKSSRL